MLILRLWFLQGIYGDFYRDKSENNRIRTIRSLAPRGSIFDREGKVLVRNRPSFTVALMIEDTKNVESTVKEVAHLAGQDPESVYKQFLADRTSRRFEPKVILRDISTDVLSKIKNKIYLLPGVIVQSVPTRAYPYNSSAAQLFGYVREVNKEQLDQFTTKGYRMGDTIGQTGLEKQYEDILRGYSGYLQVEVDAMGSRKKELGLIDDIPGKNIHLTIDIDLQQAAENALGVRKGAVVAIDPSNGEILALASGPRFDANIFSGQLSAKEWDALMKDPEKPFTNRAISSLYPPGSTSKLLWSLAGLQEGKITPNSRIHCPGYFTLGSRGNRYRCHKESGHGPLSLEMAITLSCNAYYYNLGHMLGIKNMTQYLKWFGFGQSYGLDIQGEEPGILPSEEWKRKRFGEQWYPGDSVPISIGQGYFVATPLQMAMLTAIISNDGHAYRPHLLKSKIDPETNNSVSIEPELLWKVPIASQHFKVVREFGGSVVSNERGTGKRSRVPGVAVGGKTGTAQVSKRGTQHLSKNLMDHAWFIAYAPIDKPQIALAVVVENVGGGGEFAAPVAREVLYTFFKKKGMVQEEVQANDNKSNLNINSNSTSSSNVPSSSSPETENHIEDAEVSFEDSIELQILPEVGYDVQQ